MCVGVGGGGCPRTLPRQLAGDAYWMLNDGWRRMDMSLWLAMVAAGVVRWERLCAGSVSCVPLHVWECGE